ncbi:ABC transporter ATP-binding protein [Planococcus shenhongbingii]|uniref:ABC transporter ATP-binding protein n=1 Tax=Planococcus shenhongbingii TaxID=3058398 RepID=UPI002620D7C5|nr:ABC transporter ATP-binding protein [Planococcus sp. N016]WKA58126.1 ABC transporter ATP-binding protein [Planococcus sp. N016]
MSILEISNLTKRYGEELAVKDLSFSLEQRTSTALIGPNGAGKTTTLSILAGLLKQTSGSVQLNYESGIGFLPQHPQLFPWLTALEFLEMAARLSGVRAKDVRRQSIKTLEMVGLGSAANKKTGAFSGGMKQRLGLAQAIVHQPKLLLLDEPVSALDPAGRREIMDLLKSLQHDTTILYSTHILNDAEEMTNQLLFLQHGRLVEQGSLAEVKERYAEPSIRIRFQDANCASRFAEGNRWHAITKGASVVLPIDENGPQMKEVLSVLASSAEGIIGVERQKATLEEIFLKVAGAE